MYFITVVSISFSVHIKLSSLKMGTFYNKDSWEMFLYNNNMVHSYRLSILRSHLHISIKAVNEHLRNFHSDWSGEGPNLGLSLAESTHNGAFTIMNLLMHYAQRFHQGECPSK